MGDSRVAGALEALRLLIARAACARLDRHAQRFLGAAEELAVAYPAETAAYIANLSSKADVDFAHADALEAWENQRGKEPEDAAR